MLALYIRLLGAALSCGADFSPTSYSDSASLQQYNQHNWHIMSVMSTVLWVKLGSKGGSRVPCEKNVSLRGLTGSEVEKRAANCCPSFS